MSRTSIKSVEALEPPCSSGPPEKPSKPKRRRALQQRAIITRAAIIDAAIAEFSDVGFAGATTRKIAIDAGLPNSLLHYHFPTKNELWEACADELFDDFGRALTKIRQETELGAEQLRTVFNIYLQTFISRPEMALFPRYEDNPDLARRSYIHTKHLAGQREWLTASASVAQAEGAIPDGDPTLIIAFILGAIVNIGARKFDMEYFLDRPLDATTIREFEALVERLLFTPPAGGRPSQAKRDRAGRAAERALSCLDIGGARS